MVAVEVTTRIRHLLEKASLSESIDRGPYVETVAHGVLCLALKRLGGDTTLISLLRGTGIHLSHKDAVAAHAPPPRRNKELEKRLALLRAKAEEREYRRMVGDVASMSSSNAEQESQKLGRFAPQMSIGINVIVSMATCFAAGYFVARHAFDSQPVALVAGVIGMIVAMAVEATLVLTKLYTIENAAEKQERRRTKRTVRNVGRIS